MIIKNYKTDLGTHCYSSSEEEKKIKFERASKSFIKEVILAVWLSRDSTQWIGLVWRMVRITVWAEKKNSVGEIIHHRLGKKKKKKNRT